MVLKDQEKGIKAFIKKYKVNKVLEMCNRGSNEFPHLIFKGGNGKQTNAFENGHLLWGQTKIENGDLFWDGQSIILQRIKG